MIKLEKIISKLDEEFQINGFGKDPAFSRFIPQVYDQIDFNWHSAFEKRFVSIFNGLMIKGAQNVHQVFLAVFPTDHVLKTFISTSNPGDLLFMHHPLLMECGDPQGKWGKGFVPIQEKYIKQIKEKQLSIYTCHIPMDCHKSLGTNAAIAKALNVASIYKNEGNEFILYGTINKTNTDQLMTNLLHIFDIPYVDFEGQKRENIEHVAIVAGCGDVVDWMKEAEQNGIQAYISGEIHCHIDNKYGKYKYNQMMEFAKDTKMSLIGVSHSASEYLAHRTVIKEWLEQHIPIQTVLIPQEKWWL